ncbi:hypothetical protein RFI_06008 [Reticulomyxa filosa]|uniref:Uncharacterized protein n=1 Tax=Reticulomyxa filosa TaxID=46433 RepID=X6NYP2_RETFI|nr:hypothetical protein RFI_06008 [Reticulomyxa filosa]|eukprot:ETO31111.1 hypothetical protein RFI_06008 [Reticulomyxa filosa]
MINYKKVKINYFSIIIENNNKKKCCYLSGHFSHFSAVDFLDNLRIKKLLSIALKIEKETNDERQKNKKSGTRPFLRKHKFHHNFAFSKKINYIELFCIKFMSNQNRPNNQLKNVVTRGSAVPFFLFLHL